MFIKKTKFIYITFYVLIFILIAAVFGVSYALNSLYKTSYPLHYIEYIEEYHQKYNVDKNIVLAVIHTESGFNKLALSNKNARGLMQIMEETFEWAKHRMRDERELTYNDMYIEQHNIQYGIYILSLLYEEFKTTETVLAAYHSGRGIVNKWLSTDEYLQEGKLNTEKLPYNAKNYIKKVNEAYEVYSKLY